MQVVDAERIWGRNFMFTTEGELLVAEGLLPDAYPRVKSPEVPIHGTDRLGHIAEVGDRLIGTVGEGRDKRYKVVPLRLAGVLFDSEVADERGLITADQELIPLGPQTEATVSFTGHFLDKLIANRLIAGSQDEDRLASRIGEGHRFVTHFQNQGLIRAYVENSFPDFAPTEDLGAQRVAA